VGLKILFQQIQGFVCHFIFVFFMMVWYGAFRSLVYSDAYSPHFGEDAEYPFIFWMFLAGYCLVNYCMCEYECDSRVGEWEECVVFDSNVFEMK
jgi:hypothetical protein